MTTKTLTITDDTVVEWSDDGTTWASLPGAQKVSFPEEQRDYKDKTSLDSVGMHKEWSRGLIDSGEITLGCFYTKELFAAASAKKALATPTYFRVTLPIDIDQSTGDQFAWQAWISPSLPDVEVGNDLMLDIKQKVTGAVTWTQGTAAV
ncbi:hypothetical protein TG4357_03741 [Thalassovita gelatinovora]|uniref:Uncharacterized protein n=1 Tax=Thalassovita gelatinovora TaxID=53501 RepID=A0A0P1FLI2_THAGE|nr:phage tail tube protein [Thalassovita gelatinovora]QIZ79075.1 hypothetical protein HFZ77_00580 [Thalassovita gelatinovora]CUH68692.1 hypothetical protein TG4357_03741 [Thalassovita gelatinovora]SEQ56789.1 hypothetical protein SAMN04488043_106202 [Thalassovita gelatinovora]